MRITRQHACYLMSILFFCCLIQSEKEWLYHLPQGSSSSDSIIQQYQARLETVWEELVCFPVPESTGNENAQVTFKNTWLAERNYGGQRKHEGIDLMATPDKSGYFPILSMTDGTVEQIGWLDKGGWRIGIRSTNGNYYYYAHLHSYASEWKRGDSVAAGELLGYMGDSGYGPEGTTGKFPVHLHVGIYLTGMEQEDMAINPYWMLKYLETEKRSCTF